jgi:hypothetical protein
VRFAILLSLAACGWAGSMARADDALIHAALETHSGYIMTESLAFASKADLVASIPGEPTIDGFWTPPEQDVAVADRAFRDLIHAAAKDPTLIFPDLAPNPDPTEPVDADKARDLERERAELALISGNYDSYVRQYVGIIIAGQKLVFCNYSDGTKVNPASDYIFIQKTFAVDGSSRFLQCRFEPLLKTITNVSIIGTWQPSAK